MKNAMIAPSMMCADTGNLKAQLETLEEQGIEYLHVDVMDGEFVPNFALSTDYCAFLKKNTRIPLDIHLMIKNPELKLDWFPFGEGDYVSVHYEAGAHIQKALQAIRNRGAKPMVALNPATPLQSLDYLLDVVDGVLIMTVNPGFAGQKMTPSSLHKITETRTLLDARGYSNLDIEVDGNVSMENAVKMRAAGANIFVAGTSSIFRADNALALHINELRNACK